jgi:DNA-binding protein HU-beta
VGKEFNTDKIGYVLDKELVSKFRREFNLPYDQAKRTVEAVFELAKHTRVTAGLLNIRGFGLFEVRTRKRCRYKNQYTGITDEIPMVKVVKFKPSRSIKDSINMKLGDELHRYLKKQAAIKQDLRRLARMRIDS